MLVAAANRVRFESVLEIRETDTSNNNKDINDDAGDDDDDDDDEAYDAFILSRIAQWAVGALLCRHLLATVLDGFWRWCDNPGRLSGPSSVAVVVVVAVAVVVVVKVS